MTKKSSNVTPTEHKAAKILSGNSGSKTTRELAAAVVSKAGSKKTK